ncbi:MAG: PD-(D/E)XK nuclease family protein [Labilithrix sp.]|nr:PD-(D/E)XK nuclease family protein [Labilithrix sp.]
MLAMGILGLLRFLEVSMAATLAELRKKRHLSVSAIKCFLSCPRKYHLAYVERARADYYPAALALGSAWHAAIAGWLNDEVNDGSLDAQLGADLRERLRRDDIPILFDDADEDADGFIEHAVKMFNSFCASIPRPRTVLGTEIVFETEIAHPATGEVLPLPVVGAIDAVVVEEDGVGRLWELKTASKKWPSSGGATEFDPQVTLYRKAARELGYDGISLRVLVTTKTKEPQVQTLDVDRTDGDEGELAELFFDVYRAIEAGVSFRQRGWACRTCQYASSCRP